MQWGGVPHDALEPCSACKNAVSFPRAEMQAPHSIFSRFLVKAAIRVREGNIKLSKTAAYLAAQPTSRSSINQLQEPIHLLAAFQHVARKLVFDCVDQLDQLATRGLSPEQAWNHCSVQLCKAARVSSRLV